MSLQRITKKYVLHLYIIERLTFRTDEYLKTIKANIEKTLFLDVIF